MRSTALPGIVALSVLALTACGGDNVESAPRSSGKDVSTAAPTTPSPSNKPESDPFFAYFDKIATGEPAQLEQAASLAAPNSLAYGYALNRAHIASANLDYGFDIYTRTAEYGENAVTLCAVDDASDCPKFADLALTAGRPAEFTINGADISRRLVLGDGTKVHSKGLVDFELLSAYQSMSDDSLWAIIRISSHRREIDTSYVVKYRAPDGRQVESLDSYLPSSLGPNSNQLALVIIPRAAVGGAITLKWATRDAGPLVVAEATIPTRRT